jgi:hypothetical protein
LDTANNCIRPYKPLDPSERAYTASDRGIRPSRPKAQKPVPLTRQFIENYSDVGDAILAPYAGTGTTGIASLLTQRICVLIEVEESIYIAAMNRLYRCMRYLLEQRAESAQKWLEFGLEVVKATQLWWSRQCLFAFRNPNPPPCYHPTIAKNCEAATLQILEESEYITAVAQGGIPKGGSPGHGLGTMVSYTKGDVVCCYWGIVVQYTTPEALDESFPENPRIMRFRNPLLKNMRLVGSQLCPAILINSHLNLVSLLHTYPHVHI